MIPMISNELKIRNIRVANYTLATLRYDEFEMYAMIPLSINFQSPKW